MALTKGGKGRPATTKGTEAEARGRSESHSLSGSTVMFPRWSWRWSPYFP